LFFAASFYFGCLSLSVFLYVEANNLARRFLLIYIPPRLLVAGLSLLRIASSLPWILEVSEFSLRLIYIGGKDFNYASFYRNGTEFVMPQFYESFSSADSLSFMSSSLIRWQHAKPRGIRGIPCQYHVRYPKLCVTCQLFSHRNSPSF
jgi:hypothetical protein